MMNGVVSPSCEAMIRFAIGNRNGRMQVIDAVIDTGYTGFLSVPHEIIVALSLPWTGIDRVTLGDSDLAPISIIPVWYALEHNFKAKVLCDIGVECDQPK